MVQDFSNFVAFNKDGSVITRYHLCGHFIFRDGELFERFDKERDAILRYYKLAKHFRRQGRLVTISFNPDHLCTKFPFEEYERVFCDELTEKDEEKGQRK